jgi:hypothetical protein
LLAIGDVTGKGVPAALMMATVKTALQIRTEFTQDVREIMFSLNCQEDLLTINLKILENIETFCHDTPQDVEC